MTAKPHVKQGRRIPRSSLKPRKPGVYTNNLGLKSGIEKESDMKQVSAGAIRGGCACPCLPALPLA